MNHSWLISISTKHWIVSCSAIPVCTCTCICIASKGRRNGRDRDKGDTFAFIATITKLVVGKNRSHLDLLDLLLYISCDKILFDWDLLLVRHLHSRLQWRERERERSEFYFIITVLYFDYKDLSIAIVCLRLFDAFARTIVLVYVK